MRSADDEEDLLTAYHEAGHAVVGYALGGKIERIQLGGETVDHLPDQFGDCLINWGPVSSKCNWQTHRELLTILAGPVAEMIYRGEKLHPATFGPWQQDWQQALARCTNFLSDETACIAFLERLILDLYEKLSDDSAWAAIAAVADELLAHEYLEQEQLDDALQFWLGL